MKPTWTTAPAASTSRTSSTVSSTSPESGFSQKHGIPAATERRTSPACAGVGAAITTASGPSMNASSGVAARAPIASGQLARPGGVEVGDDQLGHAVGRGEVGGVHHPDVPGAAEDDAHLGAGP